MKKFKSDLKKKNSDKSFGIIFFIFFLILSFYFYYIKSKVYYYLIVISLIFLVLSLTNSKLLSPLKKVWIKLGEILGKFISPIIMSLIYFLIVFPTNLILKILNKDILGIIIDKKKDTYWRKKEKIKSSMDNQF